MPNPPEVNSERGFRVLEILCFPHLVLAHVGDNDAVTLVRRMPQLLHNVGRDKFISLLGEDVAANRIGSPLTDLAQPRWVFVGFDFRQQRPQGHQSITDDRRVDGEVFAHLGRIKVHMNNSRLRRKRTERTRQAIIQSRANGEQHIALLQRIVAIGFTMHAAPTD